MSFLLDKAFSLPNGILINEALSGGVLITGGPSSPVGLDLPIGTVYFQPVGVGFDLWGKEGAGVNDWKIKEFVAKALITEFFASNTVSTTTSTTFQNKVNSTTTALPSGQYLILWSCEYTNNSNNRSTAIQVNFNGSLIAQDQAEFPSGGVYKITSAVFLTGVISGAKIAQIQFRRVDSGTAAIRRATIGYIKVL